MSQAGGRFAGQLPDLASVACPALVVGTGWVDGLGRGSGRLACPDDFPAHMRVRNRQTRVARVGSPGGRAGGSGTAGLDKSYLGPVLGGGRAAGVQEGYRGVNVPMHKGGWGWRGAGSVRLCRGLGFWSADWTHTGHPRPGAKPWSMEGRLAHTIGRKGMGDRKVTHLKIKGCGEKTGSD